MPDRVPTWELSQIEMLGVETYGEDGGCWRKVRNLTSKGMLRGVSGGSTGRGSISEETSAPFGRQNDLAPVVKGGMETAPSSLGEQEGDSEGN
ncbi:hypothetical protein NDU88_003784 [Pleurodeles waltl]|uniref:Uncharacterized protein n=1 Tax=Pleurodeles waltl TaxID=8319 RepID=A0AAV7NLP2_PLEWA|nr:hypothetical protein NDU88_003784 [Pleurodeles waltl]